ncbi:SDR family oxidoreductase [Streptomyces sp. HC44]|uniref:SDR family oxidoreductase n=1 Tax=Streptomyces scabichelini TaxID=2711217 RepID=A0A6G4VHX3_9ACTN|nr:SDR family NAD(P)-dependent oxidoreductase [Streptomyces scabichelini]NGO13696.1 SDR family oxidoreductase [Streptomyces scabichelini]
MAHITAHPLRVHGSTALVLGPQGTAYEVIREALEGAGAKVVDDTGEESAPDVCCVLLTGTAVLDSASPAPPLPRPRIAEIADAMAERGSGRMILVFDGAGGLHLGTPADEVASRAADLAWWRQLAARLSPSGVIANQIRVGLAPFLSHRPGPARTAAILRHLPLRRVATAADLAAAVLHLASEGCSYTVADTVPVDGGMGLMMVPPLRPPGARSHADVLAERRGGAELFDLSGRHCLVVGASSGMGRETALELARRGADVTVLARREPELLEVAHEITRSGRRAEVVAQDVARLDELAAVVERLWRIGRVDAMVYATGLFEVEAPDRQPGLRERLLDVNYRGYATLTDALVRRWAGDRQGGAVVGLGSAGAGAVPHLESYAASKAAMTQYTRNLAVSGGRHGIRANCVLPGLVTTPMADLAAEGDFQEAWLARIPQGRAGTPADVAPLAAYLVGDSAAYVTGALLHADGGLALGGLPPLAQGGLE